MAHSCPDCDEVCYCGGDIDDCELDLQPPEGCSHPCQDEDEAWRPIFSRWPKWSELYIYTLARERGRVAYWSNLTSVNAQVGVTILAKTKLTYAYHKLTAPQSPSPDGFFGDGTSRGTLHIWKLTAKMSSRLSGHFLVERFNPGDFYAEDLDDAYFLRWEVMYRR